ncbi:MAG: hypothetical protein WCZ27_10715 [Tissierellaceae bacterium]
MRAIKRNSCILAALISFDILAGIFLLLFNKTTNQIQRQTLLAAIVIINAIAMGLWLREKNRLKIANLIAENPILHITTAVISHMSAEIARQLDTENTQIIISYFGILIGEKIIKFNQDGIQLRAVEIGGDYISFTYGIKKTMQNIRLLCPNLEAEELDRLVEKFRYETGITPTIVIRGKDDGDLKP